jgi:hypothetical protein
LATRCRRLGIPVPGRGYWARLDAGQSPHRPRLPERDPQWSDDSALTVQPLTGEAGSIKVDPEAPTDVQAINEEFERCEPAALEADARWLKERLAYEAAPANKIGLEAPGRRWHAVAKAYHATYDTAAKVCPDARILLRITEPLREQHRTKIGYKGQKEVESFSVPTGHLRKIVGMHYRDGATFEDKDDASLDDSLNKVFAAFYRLVVKERTINRRDQFKDRIREAEYRKRVEAQRLLAEEEARAAEEQRRRRALLREAMRWEDAKRIRQYVAHLQVDADSRCAQASESWVRWALCVAAETDPSEHRLVAGECTAKN